mgnify:CR=1 FL=1
MPTRTRISKKGSFREMFSYASKLIKTSDPPQKLHFDTYLEGEDLVTYLTLELYSEED